MSEMLLDRPPEMMPTPEPAEMELRRDIDRYGPTEKAVADVALTGAGLVAEAGPSFGDQLSIEDEPGVGWPVTSAEKGIVDSAAPESSYIHPPEMSSLEEAKYIAGYIEHTKAHDEWTSGKIGGEEFQNRIADKTPRTYQHPLLRQDGQVFDEDKPTVVDDPNKGVGAADGTFWHASDQLMEPGDRIMPSGEVPDSVHRGNKSDRGFHSGSSPLSVATNYDRGGEKDFAFGYQRELGELPTAYGKHVYKVSSPNSKIVAVTGGQEVWAEGGANIEKRMHPDFASNYLTAASRVRGEDPLQEGLPGMENGLQFVPEADLDVTSTEFYEKHLKDTSAGVYRHAPVSNIGPEDIALPGFEDHGKPTPVSARGPGSPPVM